MPLRDYVYGLGADRVVILGDIASKISVVVKSTPIVVKVTHNPTAITVKVTVVCP